MARTMTNIKITIVAYINAFQGVGMYKKNNKVRRIVAILALILIICMGLTGIVAYLIV
jgi:hypothetical protein